MDDIFKGLFSPGVILGVVIWLIVWIAVVESRKKEKNKRTQTIGTSVININKDTEQQKTLLIGLKMTG